MGSLFDYENHTDKADICYFNYENMEPGRVWQWEENETTGFFNVATNFKHLFGTTLLRHHSLIKTDWHLLTALNPA